eukprot:GGOE01000894.1.p1 GENE.GGOE01000894.1~~GGOE01000894.1.p1  ORF type:complete len:459 (-),score=127.96 GGOE01000894.1:565-1899(-)
MPDVMPPTVEPSLEAASEFLTAPPTKKRVLILMSDTGGGHRASANAVAAALEELMPGALDLHIVDVLTEFGVWPLGNAVQDYKTLLRRPAVYGFCYWMMQQPMVRPCAESLAHLTNTAGFRRCFEEHQPDLVVSVHPFMQSLSLRALEQLGGGQRRVPFATVVTDLASCFPSWFHPKVDLCIVPSDELRQEARRCGVPSTCLRQLGLPVRREFWAGPPSPTDKPALRHKLGLPADRRLVVLMGGGDGIGLLEAIATQLHTQLASQLPTTSQLLIICGSNAALQQKLAAHPWSTVPVHVKGYTPAMATVMAAADILVTKAGPGTITEACLSGLPCIVSGFIPGQEAGNVSFVEKSGFGVHTPDPKKIAETAVAWLKDDAKWAELSAAACRAAKPDATLDIACTLLALLHSTCGRANASPQTDADFVLVSSPTEKGPTKRMRLGHH